MITNIKYYNDHHKTIKHIFIAIQCIVKITCISNPDMRGVITCPESIGCFNGCLRRLQITWWMRLWWWWWWSWWWWWTWLWWWYTWRQWQEQRGEQARCPRRQVRRPKQDSFEMGEMESSRNQPVLWKNDDNDYDVYKDGIIDDHDLIWPKHDLLWSYSEFFLPHRSDRT